MQAIKKILWVTLFIVVVSWASSAFAKDNSDLYYSIDDNAEAVTSIIKNSFGGTKEYPTVWVQFDYKPAEQVRMKAALKLPKRPIHGKLKYMFECSSQRFRQLQGAVYDSQGSVLYSVGQTEVEDVIPQSVGALVRSIVCQSEPQQQSYTY